MALAAIALPLSFLSADRANACEPEHQIHAQGTQPSCAQGCVPDPQDPLFCRCPLEVGPGGLCWTSDARLAGGNGCVNLASFKVERGKATNPLHHVCMDIANVNVPGVNYRMCDFTEDGDLVNGANPCPVRPEPPGTVHVSPSFMRYVLGGSPAPYKLPNLELAEWPDLATIQKITSPPVGVAYTSVQGEVFLSKKRAAYWLLHEVCTNEIPGVIGDEFSTVTFYSYRKPSGCIEKQARNDMSGPTDLVTAPVPCP